MFSNFHFVRNWSPSQERSDKNSKFTKFAVLSLDCNHVESFQKSEKLEALCGFGGHHLRIRDFSMEFGRPLTGQSMVTMQ